MPLVEGSLALPLALSAAALLGGTLATWLYDRRAPLPWRLAAGFCTGLAAFGLVGLALALRFGLHTWVVALAGVIVCTPAGLLLSASHRSAVAADVKKALDSAASSIRRIRPRTLVGVTVCAAGTLLLWRVADRVMFVRPDGIHTGIIHNYGDLPFHLTVTSRFVYGANLPPEHPAFAGAAFIYPFLTDFIGAMCVRAGLPVREVIVWSTLLLCLALGALLHRWTRDLTGRDDAACLAPLLAFLNGGFGWWMLVAEAGQADASLRALLAHLPHDYTITFDGQYRWGNIVTTLLATQRGLLLGLPLAVVVFHQWWLALAHTGEDRRAARARMIATGVIAGLLPLVHAHTFAVVLGVALCLALLSGDRRAWASFFVCSLALGLPQVWWLTHSGGIRGGSFLAWSVGWDHGTQNVFLFWLKNTGLFIPLLIAAVAWRGREPLAPRRLLMFYLPFTLCFIVPNLVRLAPWIWDNIKVLVYWHIASVPIVALLLARLAQGGWWRRSAAAALFLSLTLAGALDLWRVASGAVQAQVFDRRGLEFAALVSATTSPTSLILHAPIHNHPVALTGRRSLMGYAGHVWSHGLDYGPRETDIKTMYEGSTDAQALLARYGIDYVVVGPPERARMRVNDAFIGRFRLVGQAGEYRLYQTPHGR
jgi:hypothetical protein